MSRFRVCSPTDNASEALLTGLELILLTLTVYL